MDQHMPGKRVIGQILPVMDRKRAARQRRIPFFEQRQKRLLRPFFDRMAPIFQDPFIIECPRVRARTRLVGKSNVLSLFYNRVARDHKTFRL